MKKSVYEHYGRKCCDERILFHADAKKPELKAGFKLTNIGFAQAYKELDMVQKMAPIFEKSRKGTSPAVSTC